MSQNQISSELITLSLLRLIKNKTHGEYKWNLLGGIAHGHSSLEVSLGVTLDPATKYHASVCFDELRRDGYIVPFENMNTNPDDWVKITEKGLKALDEGIVDVHTADVTTADRSPFGIPNLSAFKKELSKLIEDEIVSCLFMDLDNFKAVNDTYDHSVGDEVIREIMKITELVIKGKGKMFHRSGDEILVLLPNFDPQEACAVAERIRSLIYGHSFPVIAQGFVTATIGISTAPDCCSLEQLEVVADSVAMKTKKSGKNQVAHCLGDVHFEQHQITYATELRQMLSELKTNAAIVKLQGNERIDYSSNKLNAKALDSLAPDIKSIVDAGYGAVKKIEFFVQRFGNAAPPYSIAANNDLIEVKFKELQKIIDAIAALENHLRGPEQTAK